MAQFWTRKDDREDDLRTVKPWDEMVSNGDKRFPDPHSEKKELSEYEKYCLMLEEQQEDEMEGRCIDYHPEGQFVRGH